MLIHTSIPAIDPDLVSKVLCELAGGRRCEFPYPGAYYIGFDDENSTAVEVYPIDTQLLPGAGNEYGELEPPEVSRTHMVRYMGSSESPQYIASHIALTTPLNLHQIYEVAKREKWRATYSSRREKFRLVEIWLENRVLVELILEQDLKDALTALKVDAFDSDHRRLGYDLTSGRILDKAN